MSNKKLTYDVFCGTKSMQKVALKRGYNCITIDNNPIFKADIIKDILITNLEECFYCHFSPPCISFSLAGIRHHFRKINESEYIPISENAIISLKILDKIAFLISQNKFKYWTVENPVCVFRKIFKKYLDKYNIKYKLVTITYCQYGLRRMKPTDFFTNIYNWNGKKCNYGDNCHMSSPRGSINSTQGLKNNIERGIIPYLVFEEIFNKIEENE